MKSIVLLSITAVFLMASLAFGASEILLEENSPGIPNFPGYVPNRIVVKLDPSALKKINKDLLAQGKTGIPTLDQVSTNHGANSIRIQFPKAQKKNYKGRTIDLSGWHVINFSNEVDVTAVVNEYKSAPEVIDAQPISIHPIYKSPLEQFYDRQWHLPKIQAPEAWDIQTGDANLIVAVPDTGVRYFQKDLAGADASYANPTTVSGNMWVNWVEKNGSLGIDDDANGYIDDWIGWDFVAQATTECDSLWGEDCSGEDNDPRDFHGHGTHCAGNIAAINNNGEALASVAGGWGQGFLESSGNGVKVMALRIGWSAAIGLAGYVEMDFAASALQYAADKGARIVTCSWGSENTGGLGEAIDYFLAQGGIIFKAAGNEAKDVSTTGDYMCSRDDIICVAATDQNDCKASFSNFGSWVDVAAPGTDIWSLFHYWIDPPEDYVTAMSGTSMATPLAASVAALIWSEKPAWSASEVKDQLFSSADPIDSLECNTSYAGMLGTGRINAFNAVSTIPAPDSDNDGISDEEDNCLNIPNGPNLGTCGPFSDNAGATCTSDADCASGCSSNGNCNLNQEDRDLDEYGNVCDNCPSNCNSEQGDADLDGVGDVCDDSSGCGGCSLPQCEIPC